MTTPDRQEALLDLIMLRKPVSSAIGVVKAFQWDSDAEIVTFTRADALRLLDAYLQGTVGEGLVEQWANAVEGRDDIGFERSAGELLREFIFELATPEITTALTPARAAEWEEALRAEGSELDRRP